jgi:NAD(P)-dependent dehydrogenase (short-subunit alcohol dehydrogenase family)
MNEPFIDFSGKRVVVTGASSGLGRAIALELGSRGAELILIGRDQERLRETGDAMGSAVRHIAAFDLEQVSGITPQIIQLVQAHGPLYGLCHAAGVVQTLPLAATKAEHVRRMMEVNLVAGIELARAVSRRDVMEPEGGAILFISSIYSRAGVSGQVAYCATKGAVNAAVRAMAVELARRHIRVNTLSPGMVRTPMTEAALAVLSESQVDALVNAHPLGIGSPEDVARAAAFLLAPQTRWITGADLAVDGGYTAK